MYKRDCTNHVTKNFRKDLENLAKSGIKVDGLKSTTRRKHGIGPTTIAKMGKRFRAVIMTNKVETQNEKDVSSALTKMKSGIMAVLFHCTIFEDEEFRHQYCPKGSDSWCPYRRRVVNWDSQKSHHISPQLFPYLLEVFEARSTESYLRRVVTGYNQNS